MKREINLNTNGESGKKLKKGVDEAVKNDKQQRRKNINCPRYYPHCRSPHACDMCYHLDRLEKENKELEKEQKELFRAARDVIHEYHYHHISGDEKSMKKIKKLEEVVKQIEFD